MHGIEGALYPARWPLEFFVENMEDLISKTQHGLHDTAFDLGNAANKYEWSDSASAERVWTAGREWSVPADYRERDIASTRTCYSKGPVLSLAVPADRNDSAEAKEQVYSLLGTINDWVIKLTGYDLLAKALPLVFGEWGAVRRVGHAWGEMEHGFLDIAKDLTQGLDTLSEHWDSTDSGAAGASRAFDYHIRSRWTSALEAVAQVCDYMQQYCEMAAQFYEALVDSLLFALNFYAQRIKKAALALKSAVTTVKQLKALWDLVGSLVGVIEDLIDLVGEFWVMWKQDIELGVSVIVLIRNYMRGDFDALKTA